MRDKQPCQAARAISTAEFTPWRKSFAAPLVCTALLALVASPACAAPPITARVTATGVYGNGDVYVMLDTDIAEPACPMARFDVPGSNPAAKSILATAQLAIATGKSIRIATSGCFGAAPTLDTCRSTYFYIKVD